MSQEYLLITEPGYRLAKLEMYNWGGFQGKHQADINPEGTAVIGPTGSGKTTLVDALMTLISANPKYNLASTGGHESDRDMASYVRGITGPGDGSGGQSHVARPGKTVTGLSATFCNGENLAIIGALLWFDDSSSSPTDMKKFWYFASAPEHSLDSMLEVQQHGGMRALKQRSKVETGLWAFTSKTAYLARIRDFFEVRDNAFNLLNRAAGLKQLNSIDEIFRELVLDDSSQFGRAREVADSFDDLTEIHEELLIARKQQASLEPVKATWTQCQNNALKLNELIQVDDAIPVWFAQTACRLWRTRCERLEQDYATLNVQIESVYADTDAKKNRREQLSQRYLQLGGADIETLKKLIADISTRLTSRQQNARQYAQLLAQYGMSAPLNSTQFEQSQTQLNAVEKQLSQQAEALQEQIYQTGAELFGINKRLDNLQHEQRDIENSPDSNIPGAFQHLRKALAEHLGVAETDLPFLAELVQVKAEEHSWRGAIERALGSQKLRMLVSPDYIAEALHWINGRNNKLHVRLWEVEQPAQSVHFFTDGYLCKLQYKDHPYREAARYLLARFDLHCVATPEDLRSTPHGLTLQGMMSGQRGFFDKQDQRSLQSDWFTGFDNKDRLQSLTAQIKECQAEQKVIKSRHDNFINQKKLYDQKIQLLKNALNIDYLTIDVASAEKELTVEQDKLSQLTRPETDMAKAKAALERCEKELSDLEAEKIDLIKKQAEITANLKNAQAKRSDYYARQERGLSDEVTGIMEQYFPQQQTLGINDIEEAERNAIAQIKQSLKKTQDRQNRLETDLVKFMSDARKEDRGALSEVGRELTDVDKYLERLQVLTQEALPEKLQRFQEYLNRSSDDGVTQLLATIKNETDRIEEKLEDLNSTLQRVDFQTNRYLQLVYARVTHESLRTLQKAQKQLNSARMVDDNGESHYRALKHIVELLRDACERNRTLAAKSLLDPRFRLEFKVSVLDRQNHSVIETRSGSQGGSGGEKEIIASYVLTASLSYALCPDGSNMPKFGTIVLDEAFSRSSHVVAGRIISALREFGLHALFITPNKEMKLLRNHTRSAIVVHRRGMESRLVAMSWQELEYARQKAQAVRHEIS